MVPTVNGSALWPSRKGSWEEKAWSRGRGAHSERGAHLCFLYLLTLVGTVTVRGSPRGLAGTQGHCACLLGLELQWGKARALEEVRAVTEGLVREGGGRLGWRESSALSFPWPCTWGVTERLS